MKTYFVNVWDHLRTSFWFVPTIMAVLAVLTSVTLPYLDRQLDQMAVGWIRTTIPAARTTLSAITGSLMAVIGTVFSITVVTLSLTSQQFGPRLLRTFMLDLPTQLTMGAFLSTALYCLLVLRLIEDRSALHLSVAVAVAMTVVSMGLLIHFIHHIAVLIQAPRVVSAVAHELDDAICRLYPEGCAGETDRAEQRQRTARTDEQRLGHPDSTVGAVAEGYLQAVDLDGLVHLARKAESIVRLRKRPGHFISRESPVADVWSLGDSCFALAREVNECLIVGTRRTPRQDVECAVQELSEVAVRSLSPGINDPFTANDCIDRLGAAMGRLARRAAPTSHYCDDEGMLRLVVPVVEFPDVLDAAFNQIRQYADGCPSVLIRLLETLAAVSEQAVRPEHHRAIQRHADMVLRAAEASVAEAEDLRAIRERHVAILRVPWGDEAAPSPGA